MLSDKDWQRWGSAERLAYHIERAFPAGHRMRVLFAKMTQIPDDGWPTVRQIDAALAAYEALPFDEKRRVLNGWTPQRQQMTREYAIECLSSESLDRVLKIQADGRPDRSPGIAVACMDFEFNSFAGTLEVTVKQGSKLSEVRHALRSVLAHVEEQWESLIQDGVAGYTLEDEDLAADEAEKKAASAITSLPMPGRIRGARDFSPTAA